MKLLLSVFPSFLEFNIGIIVADYKYYKYNEISLAFLPVLC